ncbi:hypothetical protein Ddye_029423 [Dipteronia dyeriana]|uniref:Ubiquitin-like protease family profile domain-containing protein n=1 Tax=Dipteronia dyeriana TaxID=168575 RepID=A0AAD9TES5_9ROSI|nr:hypothetical protein Ddye_029423 [Dipteronia dyeriana]
MKRLVKHIWQLMSPYTDPCQPKRLRTRPESVEHIFDPHGLVDADQLAAYKSFKRNINWELYIVCQHMDAYLHILRKHQRGFPTMYNQRINVLDTQFYSRWLEEDLQTVHGATTSGNRPWHEVDLVLIPCNVRGQHWLVVTVDLIRGKIEIFDP